METVYDNRELSWLKFNKRVLEEAVDNSTPPLEKLRFLSIVTSNLDEFYMVRVGNLRDKITMGELGDDDKTNLTPQKQLELIYKETQVFYKEKRNVYYSVMETLLENDVRISNVPTLFGGKLSLAKKIFAQQIKPLLSIQIVDMKNPFPHLENRVVYCALQLSKKEKTYLGIIFKSRALEQIVPISQDNEFVLTDDLIYEFSDSLFEGYKIIDKLKIRITRNADLDILESEFSAEYDYRAKMKKLIKKRVRLAPVRIEISKHISKEFKKLILNKENEKIMLVNTIPLSFSFVSELEKYIPKELKDKISYDAVRHKLPSWYDKVKTVSEQLRKSDILLSYPYDSMKPFLRLLEESANDPKVISIKITLYRVNTNSKVITQLLTAVEKGKEVLVVMELRARFDEENNINYSEILEEAGVRVLYGPKGYKVHSKICLITRKSGSKIEYFTHIGTGNYNEKTATLYTDLNLITASEKIGKDGKNFFDNISMSRLDGEYESFATSPQNLENSILKLIDDEISIQEKYGCGKIILKINSLTRKIIIDKIIEACEKNVKVSLIVRGVCCLIPNTPKLQENLEMISIVGKYLEHSRVYWFNHLNDNVIYISSADLMTRNLQNRVELACEISDETLKQQITHYLNLLLLDDVKARIMLPTGVYVHKENTKNVNVQKQLEEELSIENKEGLMPKKEKKKTNFFKWLITQKM